MSESMKVMRPTVQAEEVTFELHTLGWKAFQNLCVAIVGEAWGQTVQSFFDSRDGGRDGAFHGTWRSKTGEVFTGSFTVQCKFTSKRDKQIQIAELKDELEKAKRLASRGLADNYFLLTNARLAGSAEEEMSQAFQSIPGIKHFAAYGAERISLIIHESPRLRMLVPRVYGLGDLSQILDQRSYDQARELLSALGDDLAKFVITEAYQRSAKALVDHGFVLLLGEPACGKSTIAAALAMGALDEWGCSTLKIRDADEFVSRSNPHEPKQFFWVDDAFGTTQFDWSSGAAWNRAFPHIRAAIRRGARVLFTSRDYIYRAAKQHLKESALPVLHESQVVIEVERLSKEEREQILYNHIRLGAQSRQFKTQVKPFLPEVAAHQRFSPEIARRLGDAAFTKRLVVSKPGLDDFVAHPLELLCEIIRTLDAGSRSALALVFMRGGLLPSPIDMTRDEEAAIELIGGSLPAIRSSLSALDGSLLLLTLQDRTHAWSFKHPTVRDAFASLVAEDRELMDIYLAGTPIVKLFGEVSCGDVGIEGVKVVVPPSRYHALMTRTESFDTTIWSNEQALHHFLAHRCDREFLLQYVQRYPTFISSLQVGSYLTAVSDVSVIVRLHELNLLPEEKRASVATRIRKLAVQTPDAGFLCPGIRALLKREELTAIMHDVRTRLLPNLDDEIATWRVDFAGDEDPEDYFSRLEETLTHYKAQLAEYPAALSQIESALTNIQEHVAELREEQPGEPDSDEYFVHGSSGGGNDDLRSVFDDVDH